MASVMNAANAVSGRRAECWFIIDGNRYCFMHLINFEAKIDIGNSEVPILGRSGSGHKPAAASISWSGTAHYNNSIMRKYWLQYQKTGSMPYFEIQVTNEDPASSIGRQTVVLHDCLSNGGTIAKFDAEAEYLDEDIEGTAEDYDMPESFSNMDGME